jgi:hypothetical protein
MDWVVFSYTFPAQSTSGLRVAIWRRLQRIGAIAAGGVYVLPARDECVEAFQWLARGITQPRGSALVMRVDRFKGMNDQQLISQFNKECAAQYGQLDRELTALDAAKPGDGQLSTRKGISVRFKSCWPRFGSKAPQRRG